MKRFFDPGLRHLLLLAAFHPFAASAADRTVACVGNSITAGYGLAWLESYPDRLDSLLGPGFAVSNFGVSGKTMVRGSNDTYWSQPALANALASSPSDVVIELGTNDSKTYIWPTYGKDFKADYRAMVDTFRTLASKPVVWVTLQPWSNNPDWNILDTAIAGRVNPLIRQVALEAGTGLVDLRAAFDGRKDLYLDDSVHPNAPGARKLAETVRDLILHEPVAITWNGADLVASEGFGYSWIRDGLLLPDTTRTLANPAPGTYRVSVRIEPGSESRLVSSAYVHAGSSRVASTTEPSGPRLIAVPGGYRLAGAPHPEKIRVELLDARGRLADPDRPAPGLYRWRLAGASILGTGSILIAR